MKKSHHNRLQKILQLSALIMSTWVSSSNAQTAHHIKIGETLFNVVSKGSSEVTVVFQAGLGDGLATWNGLSTQLPDTLQTFFYDRPGYGASSAANEPRDPCTISRELRELLQAKGLQPPFILVGHSIGGLYHYVFARMYPDEVGSLVLLDPTHPAHWVTMKAQAPAAAMTIKVLRYTLFNQAARKEFDAQESCLNELPPLPKHIPVQLLFSSNFKLNERGAYEKMLRQLRQDWAKQVPQANAMEVANAGHYIHQDQTKLVTEAILGVVTRKTQK